MEEEKPVVHARVANIVGVPLAQIDKKPTGTPPPQERPSRPPELLWWFDDKTLKCQQKRFSGVYMYHGLRTFKTRKECQVALRAHKGPVTPPVTPAVTPIPPKPPIPPIPAVKIPVTPPQPPVKIPTKEPEWYFDDDMLRCKELSPDEAISKSARKFANRRECNIALAKHLRDTRREREKRPVEIAKKIKRKLSARVEELMKKRAFPRAVKEAIEKGLERKEAPRDIERIIEKVAKTNVPDYILRRTIAKRMGARGIVQYKVDTDKGTIIYQNADEQDANAILGMKMPNGEVIPLQIKVVRE